LLAITHRLDGISLFFQEALQQVAQAGVVVNDENLVGRRLAFARQSCSCVS
jgi:hypothetical protein